MKITTKTKLLFGAAAAGAAFAYLMDPVAGRRRRERLATIAQRRSDDVRDLKQRATEVREAVVGEASPDDADLTEDPDAPAVPALNDGDASLDDPSDPSAVEADAQTDEAQTDAATPHPVTLAAVAGAEVGHVGRPQAGASDEDDLPPERAAV